MLDCTTLERGFRPGLGGADPDREPVVDSDRAVSGDTAAEEASEPATVDAREGEHRSRRSRLAVRESDSGGRELKPEDALEWEWP